jgi:hypothetical protein
MISWSNTRKKNSAITRAICEETCNVDCFVFVLRFHEVTVGYDKYDNLVSILSMCESDIHDQ